MKTETSENKIDTVLNRSVDTVYPDKDSLKERLMGGEQLRIYAGIDPTAPRVHLGHVINYLMLERFRSLGHQVIVLVGDFTALIGDPSDKTSVRNRLSKEEVQENLSALKEQIGRVMDLEDKDNPVEFRFNSEWLSELSFDDVVDLASNFTVQQMIERDVFERRLSEEKPLYVHEFFYPLMQGYDSVALEADVEIGGTDQTFNMLAGRTLRKRFQNQEKFVITHPLLEDPNTGEMLMSKSEGRGVFLDDEPAEIFAQVMRIPDSGIIQFFTHCTNLPLDEVKRHEQRLNAGENPRDVKLALAEEIVALLYDDESASGAKEGFISTFSDNEIPADIQEIKAKKGDQLINLLNDAEIVPSKTQFRRLVDQGAITNLDTEEKITDDNLAVVKTTNFKIGKHRFVKIII
ncbi:MAG: tyrosine--tRNA ligase [Candidatus Paceibacterota bacterium]